MIKIIVDFLNENSRSMQVNGNRHGMSQDLPVCNLTLPIMNFQFGNFRLKTTRKFTLDGMQDVPQNYPHDLEVSAFYQNINKHNRFVHFIHIYFSLLVCSQKIRTP